jgi:hypothetical protein
MTSFDLDFDASKVRARLRELKDEWGDGNAEFIVESGADYSVQIEFGRGPIEAQDAEALRFENEDGEVIYRTSVSGHPPYPFFRPAIRELEANPEAFIFKNTQLDTLDGIDSANEAVEIVARSLESQMKTNANANAPDRSPGTHPNHPQVDTGNLRARIVARRVA